MKKGLCLVLTAALALTFCACAVQDPPQDVTTEPTVWTPVTQPTENEVTTQPTQEESTPTEPPHSQLYLPGYTAEQITQYFEEVVLQIEYSDGTGDASLVQKWKAPIYYRIYGQPTQEDLAVLTELFEQLNRVEGFPGIYEAEDGPENLSLNFLDQEGFRDKFYDLLQGEDAYGATWFWYYTDTNEIHTAQIGYRTDIDQTSRSSVLIEEIINTLGISDTELREDSIVYQYSNDNLALSDVDWVIVKLLYHPQMLCGMDREDCRAVIGQLYS